tara:strand:+ start:940 stop:1134 length:195 start_codon:yes stop_codon:yes gene_type:complete
VAKNISSIDYERVRHINILMDGLYSQLPNIYESLVERDIESAKDHLKELISELKTLHDSMEDEL